jgi:hypothetical protein
VGGADAEPSARPLLLVGVVVWWVWFRR